MPAPDCAPGGVDGRRLPQHKVDNDRERAARGLVRKFLVLILIEPELQVLAFHKTVPYYTWLGGEASTMGRTQPRGILAGRLPQQVR